MEVGRAYFETEKKHFTILDAPGMLHDCKIEFQRNKIQVYIYFSVPNKGYNGRGRRLHIILPRYLLSLKKSRILASFCGAIKGGCELQVRINEIASRIYFSYI